MAPPHLGPTARRVGAGPARLPPGAARRARADAERHQAVPVPRPGPAGLRRRRTPGTTAQFAGWVPHQTITYLWPSGPWFWLSTNSACPTGSPIGCGSPRCCSSAASACAGRRAPRSGRCGAIVGGVRLPALALHPAVPSRTSVMLLPWAAVGWLVGLTMRSATRSRGAIRRLRAGHPHRRLGQRHRLALIAPAPSCGCARRMAAHDLWRPAVDTALRIGGLSLACRCGGSPCWSSRAARRRRAVVLGDARGGVAHLGQHRDVARPGLLAVLRPRPYGFTTTASADYMESGASS